MDARVIFSKKTKEAMKKGLSPQRKGELRWGKLKEAETNGTLQQAKNRVDVGKLVGIENSKRAYSWTANLISKKAIIETIVGFDNMRAVYEYRLGTPLNYQNGRKKKKALIEQVREEAKKQNLVKEDMSVRERGRIMFTKLKELEASGELAKASCRADIATLVGYDEYEAKAGYSWVTNMINRGHLSEKMLGLSPSGKITYEYHLTGTEPLYGYEEARNRKAKKKVGQELWRWQDKVAAEQIPQAPEPQLYDEKQVVSDTKITTPIRIEITRGDTIIKVEMGNHEEISKLITTILKGE